MAMTKPACVASKKRRTVIAFVLAIVCALIVPTTAFAWERVEFQERGRVRAIGIDRTAVWVCQVPGGTYTPDGPAAATWANQAVAPWFTQMSNGLYTPEFTFVGSFASTKVGTFTEQHVDCLAKARSQTNSPYTNAMAVTTHSLHGGMGGPGRATDLSKSASETGRGFSVSGPIAADNNDWLVGHELGHSLGWPHYYTGSSEYDSPLDVMSGNFSKFGVPSFVHTVAVNRWLSGWITDGDVVEHAGPSATYSVQPHATSGTKLVFVPTSTSGQLLTLEARVLTLGDAHLNKAGILVSAVDSSAPSGISRRQGPAVGAPGSYDSMLAPGEFLTSHGVTITNTGTTGSGYSVRVSDVALPPGRLAAATVSQVIPIIGTSSTTILTPGVARVTWEPPTSPGSSPVTNYVVTDAKDDTTLCTTTELTCDVTINEYRYYQLRVAASNNVGVGVTQSLTYLSSFRFPSAPGQVTNAKVTEITPVTGTSVTAQLTPGVARVTWEPPTSSGSSPVTNYVVIDAKDRTTLCTTTELTCDVAINQFRSYELSVAAKNNEGEGVVRTLTFKPSFLCPACPGPVAAASVVEITPITGTSVTSKLTPGVARVTWEPPTNSGSSPVTNYVVIDAKDGTTLCTTTELTCDVAISEYRYYSLTVAAENEAGFGESKALTHTPTFRFPGSVYPTTSSGPETGNVTVVGETINLTASFRPTLGDRSVRLVWKAPSTMNRYTVRNSKGKTVCDTVQTSCTVNKLEPWSRHSFYLSGRFSGTSIFIEMAALSITPYRAVKKRTVNLSSVVPRSLRPTQWRAISGCRISKNAVTLTKKKCILKLNVRGRPTTLQLRR